MEKKQFKAESQRLMDLMINSIYTHKEIFLREIISNASDAIDKLAYRALTDEKVGLNREDFKIVVVPDKEARTLTVADNGIGMTQEEMENNLGTIAKSGSLQFKKETENADDAELDIIGQFGVGFYSAFMVADKVTVISKAYGGETAWKWGVRGGGRLHHRALPEGHCGHRRDHVHQGQHRGRKLRRVSGALFAFEPD